MFTDLADHLEQVDRYYQLPSRSKSTQCLHSSLKFKPRQHLSQKQTVVKKTGEEVDYAPSHNMKENAAQIT